MGVYFYHLPKWVVGSDSLIARDWLDRENRRFSKIPSASDSSAEARKRRLADLLLKMKPDLKECQFQYEEIAKLENVSVEDARLKYRYIEIEGPRIQFAVFNEHISIGIYSKVDSEELDAILAALSAEGSFVLYDPQSDVVLDLGEESIA